MEHPSKDIIYCLSYPRSGSNWFRYCFAFITETDIDKEHPLYHSHDFINDLWTLEDCFDIKNILLLRNYKEAIFSEMKNEFINYQNNFFNANSEIFDNIHSKSGTFGLLLNALARTNYMDTTLHVMKSQLQSRYAATDRWEDGSPATDFIISWYEKVYCALKPSQGPEYKSNISDSDRVSALEVWKDKINHAFRSLIYEPKNEEKLAASLHDLKIDQFFDDFTLPGFPTTKNYPTELREEPIECLLSYSLANHYHFALQLKRYYDLLEYHDKVSKTNPNNALTIKYEDFMQDPFFELSRTIKFMEQTDLITSERALTRIRDNLHKLIDNIEHHKNVSVNRYMSLGHLASGYNNYNTGGKHSEGSGKDFLKDIDNVLKSKNLELFNEYLLDYEEKK